MNLKSLRIVHIISKFDSNQGGPPKSVLSIMQAQNILGYNSKIITSSKKKKKIKNVYYGNLLFARYAFPDLNFLKLIFKNIQTADIIHIHNFWNFTVTISIIISWFCNKKIILTPHGSLDKENIKNNFFFKLIYFLIIDIFSLKFVNGFHFLNTEERKNFFLKSIIFKKSVIIPNFILPINFRFLKKSKIFKKKINFVYLGRIHPVKGIDIQIESLAKIVNEGFNAHLHIIGPDDGSLMKLKKKVHELKLENNVSFYNSIFSNKKFSFLKEANAVLLTSYRECDPMIVKETLNVGGILIATKTCGLSTLKKSNVAIIVDRQVNDIFRAMKFVISNSNKIKIIKKNTKKYVNNYLNYKVNCNQIIFYYKKVLK
jgi:glycosyltransferase involved in cell wall biosynthesis